MKIRWPGLMVVSMAASLMVPAYSAPRGAFEDGVKAFQAADYEAAAEAWTPLASAGDARAQFNLGFLHERGLGVALDPAAAAAMYTSAAELGHPAAQNALGAAYLRGSGVTQDAFKAVGWFRRASLKGFAAAQTNLGLLRESGQGVERDVLDALRLYRHAAENGDPNGAFHAARLQLFGKGTEHDVNKSHELLSEIARQGHVPAMFLLYLMNAKGVGAIKDVDAAGDWLQKVEASADAGALATVAHFYVTGLDAPLNIASDYRTAHRWYMRAAERGDVKSQRIVGLTLLYGFEDGGRNLEQALVWLKRAAERGDKYAAAALGFIYDEGNVASRDAAQAVYWLEQAALQKHFSSMELFAENVSKGELPQWNRMRGTQAAIEAVRSAAQRQEKEELCITYRWPFADLILLFATDFDPSNFPYTENAKALLGRNDNERESASEGRERYQRLVNTLPPEARLDLDVDSILHTSTRPNHCDWFLLRRSCGLAVANTMRTVLPSARACTDSEAVRSP